MLVLCFNKINYSYNLNELGAVIGIQDTENLVLWPGFGTIELTICSLRVLLICLDYV